MNSFRNFLSIKAAAYVIMAISAASILFHFLVLAHIVPADMVWGGNAKTPEQLLRLEFVSIAINFLMGFAAFLRFRYNTRNNSIANICRIAMAFFCVLLFLNTLGNLMAENHLETLIFTPLTFVLAIFCLRLSLK